MDHKVNDAIAVLDLAKLTVEQLLQLDSVMQKARSVIERNNRSDLQRNDTAFFYDGRTKVTGKVTKISVKYAVISEDTGKKWKVPLCLIVKVN